ncbi:MAG: flagellar hook protein FlgE [Smithella sp.]
MGSALWAGISGLNASSKELDVIANNLANTNTVGFKSGTTYFADVLSQSISGGASGTMQVGRGVSVTEVQTQFSNGSFETTGVATDAAIDGDGFFMVNDADGGTYYTRAGAFRLNSEGLLVDTNGYEVQGKAIVNGQPTGVLGDIALADVQSNPQVTSTFSIGVNLNSDTADSGTYSTSQTVYDTLGGEHTLTVTFTKTPATVNQWTAAATLDGNTTTPLTLSSNAFVFDTDGNMTTPGAGVDITVTVPAAAQPTNGSTINPMTWDLASDSALDITQYASSSVVRSLTSNGYSSGSLKSISIDSNGIISGFFTNGQNTEMAQLMLSKFTNPWGLQKMGDNLFAETNSSGAAIQNYAGEGGIGSLTPNSLEMSNTDIATEFIKMITAQKAYQANAKVVTTESDMMQVLMNIKQ